MAEQLRRSSTTPDPRAHVRSHGVGVEKDAIEDVRLTSTCGAFLAVESVTCARLRYWDEVCGGQRKGLEYEASDEHHKVLLEGLGLSEEFKPEEIGQQEVQEVLG